MDRFLADKGLLTQIEQVRQSVSHKASELVVTALGFLGVPYRMGGNTAETGFDCSGFVRAMYQQTVGLILPRKAEQQAAATEKIERMGMSYWNHRFDGARRVSAQPQPMQAVPGNPVGNPTGDSVQR